MNLDRPSLFFSLRNCERGLGVAFYGVFLISVLVVTSLVVNVSYGYNQRQKLQAAVDATAVGVGELVIENNSLRTSAVELKNLARQRLGLNLTSNGVQNDRIVDANFVAEFLPAVTTPQPLPDRVRVFAEMEVPGFLTSLMQSTIRREAVYGLSGGAKPVIAVLVSDVSRYFIPLPASPQLQMVKDTAVQFVNQLSVGDYFGMVSFGDVYCVPLPLRKILEEPGDGRVTGLTKSEMASDIATNVVKNCNIANMGWGTYAQGGVFKARREIETVVSALGNNAKSFAKNILLMSGCRINRSSPIGNTPMDDSLNLDDSAYDRTTGAPLGESEGKCPLVGGPTSPAASGPTQYPQLNDEDSVRAATIHQADLARRAGIEVFAVGISYSSFCDGVASPGKDRRNFLARFTYDKNWDGLTSAWKTSVPASCGYYDLPKWCTKGKMYSQCSINSDCETTSGAGDGECGNLSSSTKQRLWFIPTIYTASSVTSTVSGRAAEMKGGRLIQ